MPTPDPQGRISAIGTTGIYCRPGCSARPLERNRTRYATAVAAETAGYRACLRCRPEREPQFEIQPHWPAEVRRAVWAIATGWVERNDEADLAEALGMGQEHLDAVLVEHVGAPPEHIARSRRMHIARTLLDHTDLSVDEIATAVGERNAAALGSHFESIFRFDAARLRDNRYARESRAVAAEAPAVRVPLYHWPNAGVGATLAYLGSRAIPGVEAAEEGRYRRLVRPRSGVGHESDWWIELLKDDDGLWIRIADPTIYSGSGEILEIITRARRLLSLDEVSSAHAGSLLADLTLGPLVEGQPGLRLAGAWDPFETAVRIIVGQQVTVSAASTLAGRVLDRCGSLTAEAVASADLDGIGMPGSRVATLINMAEAVVAGEVDLDHLGGLDEAVAALTALRGIGPWTGQLIAARIMRYADAWPTGDIGLIRAWENLGGKDHADKASENWRPYRAAAIAYLWSAA